MNRSKLQIHKVIDTNEKYYIKKDIIADLPFKIVIVGKSQLSGKTNFCLNFLLKKEFYLDDFDGDNIFIVSPSYDSDFKIQTLIHQKQIPQHNLYKEYDESILETIYQMIQEDFEKAIKTKIRPVHSLIFFDDMSAGGHFKAKHYGIIAKIFSQGRHINLSCILTSQKASDVPTNAFENLTMGVFFNCSERQLDKISDDTNYIADKKSFKKAFRKATKEPHSFFVVNFTNPIDSMYMNKDFEPIEFEDNTKKE
jgi:hypothetical protein